MQGGDEKVLAILGDRPSGNRERSRSLTEHRAVPGERPGYAAQGIGEGAHRLSRRSPIFVKDSSNTHSDISRCRQVGQRFHSVLYGSHVGPLGLGHKLRLTRLVADAYERFVSM